MRFIRTRGGSHRARRSLAALAVAGASIAGGLVVTELPASAACVTTYADTNGNNPNRSFTISSSSTCNDMNFRQATVGQNYRGEYKSGASWYVGSGGWLYRSPTTTGLVVAIASIANGTTVRATGAATNAHIYVVH